MATNFEKDIYSGYFFDLHVIYRIEYRIQTTYYAHLFIHSFTCIRGIHVYPAPGAQSWELWSGIRSLWVRIPPEPVNLFTRILQCSNISLFDIPLG